MQEVQIIKASKDKVIRSGAVVKNKIRVAPYARVSTDSDEQKNSYESQKKYYQELVSNNPEWELVDIYADEAISSTQVYKRTDFMRMIHDAMEGKIDMIITKSISRFARNTLDTLSYVRQLKDKGVAVFFEKENINTLTMNGELLLVILSSLAQQESESIDEKTLEKCFVEVYNTLLDNNKEIIDNLTNTIQKIVLEEFDDNLIDSKTKEIKIIEKKISSLLDLGLESKIENTILESKMSELTKEKSKLENELNRLIEQRDSKENYNNRINDIKNKLNTLNRLECFDRQVFEYMISKIIIGKDDDN